MFHRPVAVIVSMTVVLLCARGAEAQAWVPSKGEGSVSVLFQDLFVRDHFFDRGQRADNGHIESNSLFFDITYGLSDKLAVTLGVPVVRARYTGSRPHPTAQDDGATHSGFQDVRFAVRYNAVEGPLTITPFVGTRVPTHDYEYFAHASYGPRVRELEVGTYIGRVLDPVLPDGFVQVRYSYSFAEKIAGIDHDRSSLDIEFGYFVAPRVRVFTMGSGMKTHGGIDVTEAGWRALPENVARHHDRVGRLDLLDVGGGVQVSVSKSVDVFGSYMKSLAGRNTHALDRALTVGVSWSFGRNRSLQGLLGSAESDETEDSLIKCLCQK
jgi:hypothetical protein